MCVHVYIWYYVPHVRVCVYLHVGLSEDWVVHGCPYSHWCISLCPPTLLYLLELYQFVPINMAILRYSPVSNTLIQRYRCSWLRAAPPSAQPPASLSGPEVREVSLSTREIGESLTLRQHFRNRCAEDLGVTIVQRYSHGILTLLSWNITPIPTVMFRFETGTAPQNM